MWFTNENDTIGRITTKGVITIFADPTIDNPTGIAAGPDHAVWFTNVGGDSIGRITTSATR